MSYSKVVIMNSIREILANNGIYNARVNVEILPPSQTDEKGRSTLRSEVSISIQDISGSEVSLIRDEPVHHVVDSEPQMPLQKSWALLEQPEFLTQSKTVRKTDALEPERKNYMEQEYEHDESEAVLFGTAKPSARVDWASDTTPFTPCMEKNNTDAPGGRSPQQSRERDAHLTDRQGCVETETAPQPHSAQFMFPFLPEVHRDSRSSKSSISQGTQCSRTTSVVLLDEKKTKMQEDSPPFTAVLPVPVLYTNDTEPTEPTERSINNNNNNHRKGGSVHVLESPPLRESKHQPFLGGAAVEARQPGILLSSTSSKSFNGETVSRGTTDDAEPLKFPPVNDRNCSGMSPVNVNIATNWRSSHNTGSVADGKQNMTNTSPTDTSQLNSKQRLHEMLEEQRRMEQVSEEGRARHMEVLQVAEKYLEELHQGSTPTTTARGAPVARVEFRTARSFTHRDISKSDPKSSALPRSSSLHTSTGGIRVVKFTLPQGRNEKDEAVTQLSSSPGGAQHVSSKDKFSTLLREQDKILRANDASEQEYHKLLEQAIEYHKQQKHIKEMEEKHGEDMRELEEGAL